jgi:hypothetical protein
MIGEIRNYIKEQILAVDPDFKENPSAFYDGDIGEPILDSSYQISINSLTKDFRTDYTERTMAVVVSIFGLGYRSEIENYDLLLDKAICIEDKILDLQNFHNIETISNITSNGIEASKLPSNDDGFKIDINLTLTQAYTRE